MPGPAYYLLFGKVRQGEEPAIIEDNPYRGEGLPLVTPGDYFPAAEKVMRESRQILPGKRVACEIEPERSDLITFFLDVESMSPDLDRRDMRAPSRRLLFPGDPARLEYPV